MKPSRRATARTTSTPSPIGGWNVRDSVAEMKPSEAITLENWWPTTTDCIIRKGFTQWATGMPGTVDTIMAYNGRSANKKLFAFTSTGSIYDVTAGGVVGTPIVTGLTNGQWQYVAFSNVGGNYIIACNGTDSMLRFDGTNWVSILGAASGMTISSLTGNGTTSTVTTSTAHGLQTGNTITVSGASVAAFNVGPVAITRTSATTFTYLSAGTPSATGASYTVFEVITGVTPSSILNLNIFKGRVWLVQKNSQSAWYLPTNAIQGLAAEFPLGSFYSQGGYITAMATWTIDAGVGIDDNAVFLSSEGEVLVYKGTDPSNASTFSLVGLFKQGSPVGLRCQIKYLGDVYVISQIGLQPMSESILTAQVTIKSDVTDKILPAVANQVAITGANFGWQIMTFPTANMLLLNYPVDTAGTIYAQFVMNTITGAWSKFTGYNARCWETQTNTLYFGTAGAVCIGWTGYNDNGTPIVAYGLPAFQKFGNETQLKIMKQVRPVLSTTGTPSVLVGTNIDYDTQNNTNGAFQFSTTNIMVWGTLVWNTMFWGGSYNLNRNWRFAYGAGYTASMGLKVQNNNSDVHWSSTDYSYELGGII